MSEAGFILGAHQDLEVDRISCGGEEDLPLK